METFDSGIMICAGFKDCDIIVAVCVVRNTVNTIRAELEESKNNNNNYQDAVDQKKTKRRSDTMRSPLRGRSCPLTSLIRV